MTSPCPQRAARGLPRSPLHDTRPPKDGRPADLGAALPSDPAHLRASLSIPVLEHSGAALRLYVPETHRSCRLAPARSGRARGRGSAALPRSVRPIFARNCRPARHQLATVPGLTAERPLLSPGGRCRGAQGGCAILSWSLPFPREAVGVLYLVVKPQPGISVPVSPASPPLRATPRRGTGRAGRSAPSSREPQRSHFPFRGRK